MELITNPTEINGFLGPLRMDFYSLEVIFHRDSNHRHRMQRSVRPLWRLPELIQILQGINGQNLVFLVVGTPTHLQKYNMYTVLIVVICAMVKSRVFLGMGDLPPLIGILIMGI